MLSISKFETVSKAGKFRLKRLMNGQCAVGAIFREQPETVGPAATDQIGDRWQDTLSSLFVGRNYVPATQRPDRHLTLTESGHVHRVTRTGAERGHLICLITYEPPPFVPPAHRRPPGLRSRSEHCLKRTSHVQNK